MNINDNKVNKMIRKQYIQSQNNSNSKYLIIIINQNSIQETAKMNKQNCQKTKLKSSDQRQKELSVPKDEIRMMEQAEETKQCIQPRIIRLNEFIEKNKERCEQKQCRKQRSCQKSCKSNKSQLEEIKEQKCNEKQNNCHDLLDFSAEPQRIQPKINSRASQQELIKQFFKQSSCNYQSKRSNDKCGDYNLKNLDLNMNQQKQDKKGRRQDGERESQNKQNLVQPK